MADLDKEQIAVLQTAFDNFAQGTGFITPEMVGQILKMMGSNFTEETLSDMIAEVDEDGSGQIEFEEFTILAANFIIEEDEEELKKELKEAFRLYDKEGLGFIRTEQLKEIIREIDDKLTEEDLNGIIDEVDEDGSGTMDFDEFLAMMAG